MRGVVADLFHIIFITDNSTKTVKALERDAHLRCIYYFMNLAVQQCIRTSG